MHGALNNQRPGAETGADPKFNATYVWMISCAAALGGLLFGYDWVVIGGAKPFYEKYFNLHSEQTIGWANSCALLGCLLGSAISGWVSDRFGRRKLLIISALLFALSSALTASANSFEAFIGYRVAGGIAIGLASNVSPTYIAEISPAQWRGRLVSLNQLTIVVGILAAQIVDWLIAEKVPPNATAEFIRQSWNGQFGWRWMFAVVVVPSLVFLGAAWLAPESPRWLLSRGRRDQARAILSRIGGDNYASQTMERIPPAKVTPVRWAELKERGVARALLIGITLAVLQQWSGINVIFNYAEEIYQRAGYGVSDILFNIIITGTINMVFTLVALGFVDKLGRRPLLLLGCAGIGVSHLLIGIAYRLGLIGLPILLLTLCTIGCYAMSLAPVTWVLISEIFPNRVRGVAISLSVSGLWIAAFLLTYSFPMINRTLGSAGTFWLYSGICFAGFAFVFRFVPETKGKTLEQIEAALGDARP